MRKLSFAFSLFCFCFLSFQASAQLIGSGVTLTNTQTFGPASSNVAFIYIPSRTVSLSNVTNTGTVWFGNYEFSLNVGGSNVVVTGTVSNAFAGASLPASTNIVIGPITVPLTNYLFLQSVVNSNYTLTGFSP